MEKKYFIVNSLRLAQAISYCGFQYYIMDDRVNEGKKIYSFIDSAELREVFKIMIDTRKKYKKI